MLAAFPASHPVGPTILRVNIYEELSCAGEKGGGGGGGGCSCGPDVTAAAAAAAAALPAAMAADLLTHFSM